MEIGDGNWGWKLGMEIGDGNWVIRKLHGKRPRGLRGAVSEGMQRIPGEVWALVLSSVTNVVPFASASRQQLRQHSRQLQKQKQVHEAEQAAVQAAHASLQASLQARLLERIDNTLEMYDFGDCDHIAELRQVIDDLKMGRVSVEYTRDKLSSAAAANVPPGTTVLMGYSHEMHSHGMHSHGMHSRGMHSHGMHSCVNKPALGFGISSQ
jgi:hypothetical protein